MSKSVATNSVEPAPPQSPDWSLVHFLVRCGRCGCDLHGRDEPICPQCSLEFDWEHVVPLEQLTCSTCEYHLYGLSETRCPECGTAFVWDDVLEDFRRRQKPFFEYHWRKKPFRSFMSSLWLSLRPRKLWRLADVHDPPATGNLAMLALLAVLLFILVPWGIDYVGTAALEALDSRFHLTVARWRGWSPYTTIQSMTPISWQIFLVTWFAALFGAQMIFRQSMRKCKVRSHHVFRAWVYALLPVMIVGPCNSVLAFAFHLAALVSNSFELMYMWVLLSMVSFSLVILISVYSMTFAYRNYIKMPHAVGVALSIEAIGICVGMICQLQSILY